MSLFWKCPCYICSHQHQYRGFRQVIQTKTGWNRLYPSTVLCLSGTGHIKGISKHTMAVPVGAMVSWSSHRWCVWRTWLVLLCHGAILLLCCGHESMSGVFYFCFLLYSVFAGFTQSFSVSLTTQKNLSRRNNFCLAVHQITLGSRPTPTSLIMSTCRNAVLCV